MKTHLLFLSFFLVFCTSIKLSAFSGGSGTTGDPYLVSNSADLIQVAGTLDAGAYFKQTVDIALSGSWTTPIGTSASKFLGNYDGGGFKITGLSITAAAAVQGLFGAIGSGATIKNLDIANATVNGNTYSTIGILVALNNGGTIENCFTSGTLSGSGSVYGGLVGNLNTGVIKNCYSTANVSTSSTSATSSVGGLLGSAAVGTIENCYTTGATTNNTGRAGGLIGLTGSVVAPVINYCYSTGIVTAATCGGFIGYYSKGSFTDCYFDYNTAGTSNPNGAYQTSAPTGITAKTSAEMKTQTTFSTWNFTTIWEIIPGFYPRLISNPDPALPVELNSFTVEVSRNVIKLNWQTATEVNNNRFEVERIEQKSGNWVILGFVQGNGNSSSPKSYSFTDAPTGGNEFKYRLKQIDIDGKYKYSPEVVIKLEAPKNFSVKQNYPNPFNPTTKIDFSISSDDHVQITVFNVLGMEVATLLNEHRQAGTHSIEFNASNLSSGIYFYKIVSGKHSEIIKMILLR